MTFLPVLRRYSPIARALIARRRARNRTRLALWEWEGGSLRQAGSPRDAATLAALRDASHADAVMDVVMEAIRGIRLAMPDDVSARFTPSRLQSRDDVEHWARRMAAPGTRGRPAQEDMLALLRAALVRFDEIGPSRSRIDA